MKKNLLQAIGILIVSVVVTLFLEYYDEQRLQATNFKLHGLNGLYMKKNLLQAIGILIVSVVVTLFLEYYDEQRLQAHHQQEIDQHLQKLQSRLQHVIAEVMEKNTLLAERLAEQPEALDDPEGYGILQEDLLPPFFFNLSFARGYTVVATYPYEGRSEERRVGKEWRG